LFAEPVLPGDDGMFHRLELDVEDALNAKRSLSRVVGLVCAGRAEALRYQ
jgi:hypothetical protein